jgi:RND family efflux transporter MFP subunit
MNSKMLPLTDIVSHEPIDGPPGFGVRRVAPLSEGWNEAQSSNTLRSAGADKAELAFRTPRRWREHPGPILPMVPTLVSVGALLLALLGFGCGKKHPATGTAQDLPVATVQVRAVESLKRMATEEVVATVRPKLSASLSAKVSGSVQQMLAAPGQAVKTGDLLVQIDAREIQARLDQAQAVREQVKKDVERFTVLLKQNALTQQEFDAAQSRLRVAEATVAEAQTMLGYTRLTAPFDGIVTAKRADVGDLATPGKPLVDLEDPTTLRLEADVPEALVDKVKLAQHYSVNIPNVGAVLQGTVAEVAPVADSVSRTFRVKLDLPATPGLRSGLFGRMAVPVADVEAIRVPASAVVVRGQMELAFVVVNRRAQLRLVKTGKHLGPEVEIVAGLSPGEPLVVDGASRLQDGQPVEVKP